MNFKYVTSLTKEKTALVIPNAIQVWTESEKVLCTVVLNNLLCLR
jgi:hypothetical protein